MILNLVRAVVHVVTYALALYAAHQYGTGAEPATLWLCLAFACACLLMLAGTVARFDALFPEATNRNRR